MTVTVWVLVLYMSGFQHGGPAVIDNIASKHACELLLKEIKFGRCYSVEKIS
jgi:hypothetical protein